MPRWKLFLLLAAARFCSGQGYGEAQTWIPSDAVHLPAAEVRSLLTQICPGPPNASGCSACPRGTAAGDHGGGGPWELRAIFLGHFLSPASQDALVSGFGCESHADNEGGSYLFTQRDSRWSRVRYTHGLIAWACKKLAASDGRDRLFCGISNVAQGEVFSTLYLLDPAFDPSKGWSIVFGVEDTTGAMSSHFQKASIDRVEFHDNQIAVLAHLGSATVPREIVEKAAAAGTDPKIAIETQPRRYDFVFEGIRIVPSPKNPPTRDHIAVAPATNYSIAK